MLLGGAQPRGTDHEILQCTNHLRAEYHLLPLQWHRGLAAIAKQHATAVAEGRAAFSHSGARDRFTALPTKCINIAENLARSEGFALEDLPQATVDGWGDSEGHRRNLLGPFDACGIGWATSDAGVIFITQLLALLDERSHLRGQVHENAVVLATSTPAMCATFGMLLGGPAGAVASGLIGGALEYKFGLKATNVPSLVCDRIMGNRRRRVCARCRLVPLEGELLMTDSRSEPVCASCHTSTSGPDNDFWCFLD